MNEKRAKKVQELIKELGAIQAEVDMLKDEEDADRGSILSVLTLDALTGASDFIQDAIDYLMEAAS